MGAPLSDIAGLILAGGRSRRMGGVEKAFLDLSGRPLIAHVIARLAPQVGTLILSANGDAARFAEFGLPVIGDTHPDAPGPLAGILAGLRWLEREAPHVTHVLTAPVDTPFLPHDLAARLAAEAGMHPSKPVVAMSEGRQHHVVGLWPVGLADTVEAALRGDRRRVEDFLVQTGSVSVSFSFATIGGQRVDPFFNVNAPGDLEAASRIAGSSALPPVLGVAGWSGAGKTTLVVALIAELTGRGFRVATVKHSHHDLDPAGAETDGARHARTGAVNTAVVGPRQWIVGGEVHAGAEPPLEAVLGHLADADLILVEGYKSAPISKIEVRSGHEVDPPLAVSDARVIAIAADQAVAEAGVPTFARDDVAGIAEFIIARFGLEAGR